MDQYELNEENLVNFVLDSETRSNLFTSINAEEGTFLPLTNLYQEIGSRCQATSDQIRQVIHVLIGAFVDDWFIEPFVFHPNAPDDVLFELFKLERCIVALAHRGGPQALLEMIASKYRISEAITTLALSYYGTSAYDNKKFADFIMEYKDDYMLRYNVNRIASEEKRAIALSILK